MTVGSPLFASRIRRGRHLSRLGDATIARLARETRSVELSEGQHLFRSGDSASMFCLLESGLVLISVPRRDGESAILGLFGPRECVGLSAALSDHSTFPGDAVVLSPKVSALLLPARAARELSAEDPTCGAALRDALLDHTQALRVKIEILSAGVVRSRLAALLVHLAERFGDETESGETFIPIVLSRPALAQLVSARPETVIRALTKWRHEGLVTADEEGFTIRSIDSLRQILDA